MNVVGVRVKEPVSPDEGDAPARPLFDDAAMVVMIERNETRIGFRDSRPDR